MGDQNMLYMVLNYYNYQNRLNEVHLVYLQNFCIWDDIVRVAIFFYIGYGSWSVIKKVKWYKLCGCLENIACDMIIGGFKNFLWNLEIDQKKIHGSWYKTIRITQIG